MYSILIAQTNTLICHFLIKRKEGNLYITYAILQPEFFCLWHVIEILPHQGTLATPWFFLLQSTPWYGQTTVL
jgi:hypothetical protein